MAREVAINLERGGSTADEEQYERLRHQVMFLFERDLVSAEMERVNRQLWLLEGLAGTNPNKLDSHLHARLKGELTNATSMRLKDTGLLDEWTQSWDMREAGGSNLSPEPNTVPNSSPRAAIHLVPR